MHLLRINLPISTSKHSMLTACSLPHVKTGGLPDCLVARMAPVSRSPERRRTPEHSLGGRFVTTHHRRLSQTNAFENGKLAVFLKGLYERLKELLFFNFPAAAISPFSFSFNLLSTASFQIMTISQLEYVTGLLKKPNAVTMATPTLNYVTYQK